ncbi:MAG: WG repeat-containing protein [Saprospiraceae bacterium]|nr:WG repeat-containing protein [Saprospiraceae bacterium]
MSVLPHPNGPFPQIYRLILSLLTLMGPSLLVAQDDCQCILIDADSLTTGEDRDYELAIHKYNAAAICDKKLLSKVNERLVRVYQLIASDRDEAVRQRERADALTEVAQKNLAQAQRLLAFYNFGAGEKASWAYKDGNFAVLNENAETQTSFIYQNPETFYQGVALAQLNGKFIFLNDQGEELTERYDFVFKSEIPHLYKTNESWIHILEQTRANNYNLENYTEFEPAPSGHYFFATDAGWGLKDSLLNTIIAPRFEQVEWFSQDYFWAKEGGTYYPFESSGKRIQNWACKDQSDVEFFLKYVVRGIIEPEVYVQLQAQFDEYRGPQDNRIAVKKDNLWGYVDTEGKLQVDIRYDEVEDFSEGLAGVEYVTENPDYYDPDQIWGFIDTMGAFVVNSNYVEIQAYQGGIGGASGVNEVDRTGFNYWELFDREGREIKVDGGDIDYYEVVDSGLAIIGIGSFVSDTSLGRNVGYGLIDIKGEFLIDPLYDSIIYNAQGWASASQANQDTIYIWNEMAYRTFLQHQAEADRLAQQDTLAFKLVEEYGEYELHTLDGTIVEVPGRASDSPIKEGAFVKFSYNEWEEWMEAYTPPAIDKTTYWGIVTADGFFFTEDYQPQTYTDIQVVDQYYAIAEDRDSSVYLFNGKTTEQFGDFNEIRKVAFQTFVVRKNSQYGMLDFNKNFQISTKYEALKAPDSLLGLIPAKKQGKWGYIDENEEVVIPFYFDECQAFSGRVAKVGIDAAGSRETFQINPRGELLIQRPKRFQF